MGQDLGEYYGTTNKFDWHIKLHVAGLKKQQKM